MWNVDKQAGCAVSMDSFLEALTNGAMRQPLPAMMEAVERIRAGGLKTAVLSNNFLLPGGESYLPLDHRMFNVVRADRETESSDGQK